MVHDPEVSLPTVLTITIGHYREKVRRGRERAGVAYREERRAPGFHALAVRRAGAAALVRRVPNTPAGACCRRMYRDERR